MSDSPIVIEDYFRSNSRRKIEQALAAVVLAIPLLYLLTYRSMEVWLWRYSGRLVVIIVAYSIVYVASVSYRIHVPKLVDSIRSRVVVMLASLVISLVIAESVLQMFDPMPYSPLPDIGRHKYDADLGHIYFANYTQIIQKREFRQPWQTNSQGVRANRDFGPKRAGVTRILVVGDSFTVGDQVPLESTYPGILQSLMDRHLRDKTVEVINAGFPGYGTVHEARYIRKFGRQFEPDLIVLGMTPNDLFDNVNPLSVVARSGALIKSDSSSGQVAQYLDSFRWFSLPGWVERSLLKQKLNLLGKQFEKERPTVLSGALRADLDEDMRAKYALGEKYLLEARAEAAGIGASFAFVAIPFRQQLGAVEPGIDPSLFGRRWKEFARQYRIPYLDLLPAFRSHKDPSSLYWVEDSHCTAAGYKVIGEALFDFLRRIGPNVGLPAFARESNLGNVDDVE